jgi:hypothetical protein
MCQWKEELTNSAKRTAQGERDERQDDDDGDDDDNNNNNNNLALTSLLSATHSAPCVIWDFHWK